MRWYSALFRGGRGGRYKLIAGKHECATGGPGTAKHAPEWSRERPRHRQQVIAYYLILEYPPLPRSMRQNEVGRDHGTENKWFLLSCLTYCSPWHKPPWLILVASCMLNCKNPTLLLKARSLRVQMLYFSLMLAQNWKPSNLNSTFLTKTWSLRA